MPKEMWEMFKWIGIVCTIGFWVWFILRYWFEPDAEDLKKFRERDQ